MRKLIFLSILFLPCSILAQRADSSSTKKISFGFILSPDYCFRTLQSDNVPIDNYILHSRDSLEIPKIGFTSGATVNFKFCKRFEFQTGLLYSNRGEKQKEVAAVYSTMSTTPDPSLPKSFKVNFIYQYLEVPLHLKFCFVQTKHFQFNLLAGAAASIYLKTRFKQTLIYPSGYEKTTSNSGNDGFSRLNPTMNFGLGFCYKMNNKISIEFEPVYRRSILPIVDAPIKQWNYSYGIVCGIFFSGK